MPSRTLRDEVMIQREALYGSCSTKQLRMESLVTSEYLRECGVLASFQNIERVSAQGCATALSDVHKAHAMEIAAIIKEAREQEERISPKWEERFPSPFS